MEVTFESEWNLNVLLLTKCYVELTSIALYFLEGYRGLGVETYSIPAESRNKEPGARGPTQCALWGATGIRWELKGWSVMMCLSQFKSTLEILSPSLCHFVMTFAINKKTFRAVIFCSFCVSDHLNYCSQNEQICSWGVAEMTRVPSEKFSWD